MSLDKEILDEFEKESSGLLNELTDVVEDLETPSKEFPKAQMEEFALKIDRIMGASKTLLQMEEGHKGLTLMGQIAEVCKFVGYKAAEIQNPRMVPIFAAFWADVIEVMEDILKHLEDDDKVTAISGEYGPVLQKRLNWLKDRLGKEKEKEAAQADGGSSSGPSGPISQNDIDSIMADFGI